MRKVTKKTVDEAKDEVIETVEVTIEAPKASKAPKTAIQELIEAYKLQNPKKAELKKAELELKANQ